MSEVENLELKKRARRRLVGAAALALFAAIVLPMVMDEEPRSLQGHDIQVTIPERNATGALTLPVDGHPVEPPEETSVTPQPSPVDTLENAVTPSAPVTPPQEQRQEPPRRPDAPVAPSKPAPSVEKAPPVRAEIANGSEEARVRAILEGAPANASVASVQRYFVQVGAFGDRNKAVTLSDNLSAQGFQAYSEQAGAVTRVRVGPFLNRQEAERTITKLKGLGMDGVITSR